MLDTYCRLCGKPIKRKPSLIQVSATPNGSLIDVCAKHYGEKDFWERLDQIKKPT